MHQFLLCVSIQQTTIMHSVHTLFLEACSVRIWSFDTMQASWDLSNKNIKRAMLIYHGMHSVVLHTRWSELYN